MEVEVKVEVGMVIVVSCSNLRLGSSADVV